MAGALDGVKVLDMSRVIAGPCCGMILGDLGAEVIKVEKAGEGDMSRANHPLIKGESTYFFVYNRNKKSVTIDFRSDKGKRLLADMVKKADVLVENFRAGTLEAMGFGYEELKKLNPGIILTRISGFGQDGPYSHRTCFDGAAQAMSGIMEVTGDENGSPSMVGTYVVDCSTALYAVIGTLAALRSRSVTGHGQVVDVSLLDSAVSLLHTAITDHYMLGHDMTRMGNKDRYAWPANVYKACDNRYVYIHAGMDNTFSAIAKIIGREDLLQDKRYNNRIGRSQNIESCDELVQAWVGGKTAAEVISVISEAGIPCAIVNDIEGMINDPQIKHRNMVVKVDHPVIGELYIPGPVVKFSGTPSDVRYAPPVLGEHNREVFKEWLSLSDEQITKLEQEKII